MKPFEIVDAPSVKEAPALLQGAALYKAGGLDLLDLMKAGVAAPERLVNLVKLKGLSSVEADAEGTHIGALTTLAQLSADISDSIEAVGILGKAAGGAATPQVRNVATVGGNLLQRPRCWYYRLGHVPCRKKGGTDCPAIAGDNRHHAVFDTQVCPSVHASSLAVPLIALDGVVHTLGPKGERKIAAVDFFSSTDATRENVLLPDEVITEVILPPKWSGSKGAYYEARHKESFDWPIVSCAVAVNIQRGRCRLARVVLGGVAPVPRRSEPAEKVLMDAVLKTEEGGRNAAEAAAKVAFEDAKPLSGNAYKVQVGLAVVKRAILMSLGLYRED